MSHPKAQCNIDFVLGWGIVYTDVKFKMFPQKNGSCVVLVLRTIRVFNL